MHLSQRQIDRETGCGWSRSQTGAQNPIWILAFFSGCTGEMGTKHEHRTVNDGRAECWPVWGNRNGGGAEALSTGKIQHPGGEGVGQVESGRAGAGVSTVEGLPRQEGAGASDQAEEVKGESWGQHLQGSLRSVNQCGDITQWLHHHAGSHGRGLQSGGLLPCHFPR